LGGGESRWEGTRGDEPAARGAEREEERRLERGEDREL